MQMKLKYELSGALRGSVAVHQPTAVHIVGGQFHAHAVTQQHANVIFSHFAGQVCQQLVPIIQFHTECGIGQRLDNGAFNN